jgi:hypothetical protein
MISSRLLKLPLEFGSLYTGNVKGSTVLLILYMTALSSGTLKQIQTFWFASRRDGLLIRT